MTARRRPFDLPEHSAHNERVAALIADLAQLGTARLALQGCYTLAEVDFGSTEAAAFADEFLQRLTERLCARFTNNPIAADLLHLAVCEPEAMTSADRQAVEPFSPFLSVAAPVIVAAYALESALDTVLFQPEADKAREEESRRWHAHLDLECLRDAFAVAIAALEALIADLIAERVTLPLSCIAVTPDAYSEAVLEAGGALCRRARGFAPFAPVTDEAPRSARAPAAPMTDEAFELAEAEVIAADAALADARAFFAWALRKGAAHLEADFFAVVADTEAARRAACDAERQRDVTEGEADELGPEAFADAFAAAADKLSSAHLALLNFSLRESRFVADALSSLE